MTSSGGSRTCCASARRRSSARSSAGTGSSTRARTPCRRRCSRRPLQWPAEGMPDRPRSWLLTVAGRALVDEWRSDSARRRREETVAALEPAGRPPAADAAPTRRRRRHARAAVPVLPSGAVAAVAARAHAAGRRRPDHRGDRGRVPGARVHDGQAHQPRQAAHPRRRRPVRAADRSQSAPSGSASSCTCST